MSTPSAATSIKAVHQLLASAMPGDAIFNEALLLRDWLRGWGYASEIYAEGVDRTLPAGQATSYARFPAKARDAAVVFHYSTGSALTDFVLGLSLPVLLVYHNVTPSEYFAGVHEGLHVATRRGRAELVRLAGVRLALAHSDYSRRELEHLGFRQTDVFPFCFDAGRYALEPDAGVLERFNDGYTNLLFVGRVVPNKKQEDVLRAFHYYKRINPRSRLFLVGSWDLCERYKTFLDGFVRSAGLTDVHFCGHVTAAALVAYYRLASVFVCMSEHEGFGVPLLECMHFRVPIIAYAATAIPDTLGNAGVLFRKKDYPAIAEMIHLLVSDQALRERVLDTQSERLASFTPERVKPAFLSYLRAAAG